MKKDLLARHRAFLFLGFILGLYQFWSAIWFGAGPNLPSCRGIPLSAETIGMLCVLFLCCLLALPLLLQVARATRSVFIRALALLGYAKGFSALLLAVASVISFGDFPRRDLITHHCLRLADPIQCSAELRAAGGKNRLFSGAQLAAIRRVAATANEAPAPGTKGEKVKALYEELRAAYGARRWEEAQSLGTSLARLAPGYRDTYFFLKSAALEQRIEIEDQRAEELRFWATRPGHGTGALEREARKLLPRARHSPEARLELMRALREIHHRNPASVVGRDVMHELGIWERGLY